MSLTHTHHGGNMPASHRHGYHYNHYNYHHDLLMAGVKYEQARSVVQGLIRFAISSMMMMMMITLTWSTSK